MISGADEFQNRVINQPWTSKTVVSAGPGTGKSFTAALRVESLIRQFQNSEEQSDSKVLCITFTNAATDVTRERLSGVGVVAGVEVSTLDRWCMKLLRSLDLSSDSPIDSNPDENIRNLIDIIGKPDFVDLGAEVDHIVIDEAQDIYGVRFELCKILFEKNLITGWTVFGDLAQEIFDYDLAVDSCSLLEWIINEDRFDEHLNLMVDHRSKSEKAKSVRALGGGLREAHPSEDAIRSIWNQYSDTPPLSLSEFAVAASRYNDSGMSTGVLLRTNRQLLEVSLMLANHSNSHQVAIDRSDITYPSWLSDLDDVNSIDEALAVCPNFLDINYSRRIFNRWSSGNSRGAFALDVFSQLLRTKRLPELFLKKDPHVLTLSTVHRAKGLEYEKVVVGLQRGGEKTYEQEVQEARTLFVALTRSHDSIVRLNIEGLRTHSQKQIFGGDSRWVDFSFKGKSRFPIALEAKMSDLSFLVHPGLLEIGTHIEIREIGELETGVPLLGAFGEGEREPFAHFGQSFSLAVNSLWEQSDCNLFLGLIVSGMCSIPVPQRSRGNWEQKYIAKVPYIAGMVSPSKEK
jgi:superfamily I DNA/RNA helicase